MASLRLCALLLLVAVSAVYAQDTVDCDWTECDAPCGGGRRTCNREPEKPYRIYCYMQSCDQSSQCGRADVVFVLDSSGSLGPKNWWKTKQFAIDLSRGLQISEKDSRVGLVTFSNVPVTTFQLGDYNDHDSLEEAIWAAPWISKTTNTKDALHAAQDVFETSGRPGVKHIIVLVTDGVSNMGKELTIPAAEEVQAEGIEIFSIGIGKVDEVEVRGIASEKKDAHAFLIENFSDLTDITSSIVDSTCEAANRTVCGEFGAYQDKCVLDDPIKNCGPGKYFRTRECRFYLYEGAEPTIREDIDSMACEGPVCPCEEWTSCDKQCGGGVETCVERPSETRECNNDPCPTTEPPTTTEMETPTPTPTPTTTISTTPEDSCSCLADKKEQLAQCAQLLQDLADNGGK